jgi:glycine/D-amino acid oxidase-like deaminating enzyme
VVDVPVLGAGMVGVASANATQRRGFSVVLIDRREPGSETSYGNAGILSIGSIFPLNMPSRWRKAAYLPDQPKSRATLESGLGLGQRPTPDPSPCGPQGGGENKELAAVS